MILFVFYLNEHAKQPADLFDRQAVILYMLMIFFFCLTAFVTTVITIRGAVNLFLVPDRIEFFTASSTDMG